MTFLLALPCQVLVFGHNFGYWPGSISQKIVGDPEVFLKPMSIEDITFYVHTFLFLKLVTLITLFAFIFRTNLSERTKVLGLNASFLAAILKVAGLYGTAYLWKWFSYLVWVTFFAGEIFVAGTLIYALWFLMKGPKVSGGLVRY